MKTGFYLGVCGHREILFSLHGIEIQMRIQNFLPQFETGTYTANVYKQTTDKLMLKSVISTIR